MNTYLRWMAALSVAALLAMTPGCYTQVGTTDDLYSDEYAKDGPEPEAPAADQSVVRPEDEEEEYFTDDGEPLNRFYLGIAPSWVYGGVVYSTYSPWVYDPFWCWNPWPVSYWYPGWSYWPPAYYPPAYYPPYYPHEGRGYTSVRTMGTTRGGGSGRGLTASPRGGDGGRAPEVSAPATGRQLEIPGAARVGRSGAATGSGQTPKSTPDRIRRGERSGASGTGVRSGSSRPKSGEAVRTPRRSPRSAEGSAGSGSKAPVQGGGQSPSVRGGGRESVRPASPPPPSGGSSGRGDARPATPPAGNQGRGGGRR